MIKTHHTEHRAKAEPTGFAAKQLDDLHRVFQVASLPANERIS